MGWFSRLLGTHDSHADGASQAGAAAPELPANTVLVDVRSQGEYDSGYIQGAISLPLERIHVDITEVVPDRATPLVLYCRSGARSERACAIVAQLGYEAVSNGGGVGSLALMLNRPVLRSGR